MTEKPKSTTFYSLLITQTLSFIGSRMTALALSIWIFNETGEATPLVLVSFFAFLPRLFSASLAGLLADRWNRRYVMMIADAGQAVGTVLLLLSFVSGEFQVWHLYVVTVIQATFDIFQTPAFQATVSTLITDQNRNRANAIQMITTPVSGIIAPAITGAMYALVGVSGIIAIDLITFLVSMGVLAVLHIPQPELTTQSDQPRSIWREAMAGFEFVFQRKPLLMIFVFTGCSNFFHAGVLAMNTPYILNRTGSEATLGVLLGVFSLGTLAGTVLMGTWGGTKRRVHTMMPVIGTMGLIWILYGMQTNPIVMAPLLLLIAMASPINNISIISTLQVKVPPELQGRVFAAISQISMTLIPLSYLVMGPLADRVFEPFAQGEAWGPPLSTLFGNGSGAGMGLMLSLCGIAIALNAFSIYSLSIVRNLETLLPDYSPTAVVTLEAQDEAPSVGQAPAPEPA
jgi:MFS transporter, DHA3 family, macrolide efflux protein